MKLLLDYNTQDMLVSIERIDVDYGKVSLDTSKEIVSFLTELIPLLSPKTLGVMVRDIESSKKTFSNIGKEHPTLKNWEEFEKTACIVLKEKYDSHIILNGLSTEITPRYSDYKFDKRIEITKKQFSRILKGAFIYALPRYSYMVYTTTAYLLRHKENITKEDKEYIVKAINDRVEKFKNVTPPLFYEREILNDWECFREQLKE